MLKLCIALALLVALVAIFLGLVYAVLYFDFQPSEDGSQPYNHVNQYEDWFQ